MDQTVEFLKQMNIATASRATFYRIQKAFVNPIIWLTWMEMKTELHDELRDKELKVAGDGQFDSPGYSATYCFYTVVEKTTNKVIFKTSSRGNGDPNTKTMGNLHIEIFFS